MVRRSGRDPCRVLCALRIEVRKHFQSNSSRSRCGRDVQNITFSLLQISHHLKQIARLRIALRSKHAHQALGRTSERRAQARKTDRAVHILAQNNLPSFQIARNHAGDCLAQQRSPELRAALQVGFHRVAEFACRHSSLTSLSIVYTFATIAGRFQYLPAVAFSCRLPAG
jgi:hypothetical protein